MLSYSPTPRILEFKFIGELFLYQLHTPLSHGTFADQMTFQYSDAFVLSC